MLPQNHLEEQLNSENIIEQPKYECKKYFFDLINVLLPICCFMGTFGTLILVCFKIYKI
tara:strand:+ start:7634 stop:7810 length:177 start_codon:yes stop_codon:yes gene_type:complete